MDCLYHVKTHTPAVASRPTLNFIVRFVLGRSRADSEATSPRASRALADLYVELFSMNVN